MQRNPQDRTVLITGAAGSLGSALARQLSAAGARLALLDRDAAGLERLAAELGGPGPRLATAAADLTDEAAVHAAVAALRAAVGPVDWAVLGAGISHVAPFGADDVAAVRRVMEVNFFGAVHVAAATVDDVVARGGLFVAVSSVAGFAPLVGRTGYCASKFALHGFFETLRTEIEPRGAGVLMACPTFFETGMDRGAAYAAADPEAQAAARIGRVATPAEVATAILAAARAGLPLVVIGRTGKLAYWLRRLAPRAFERGMRRRVRV